MKLTRLAKTSPHSAYFLYTSSVKHELTYLQRIGLDPSIIKDIERCSKTMVESLVGQTIVDEKIHEQVSNPTRFGGLAINTKWLEEETRELHARCVESTKELKQILMSNENTIPERKERKVVCLPYCASSIVVL